jgi:hypothetical protein
MRVVQPPPGPDTDLDAVGAALGEEPRPFGRRDVARNQLEVAEVFPERRQGALHDAGVAVGDVDDQHVHAGADELGGALEVVAGRADRGAHAQATLCVARGEGEPPLAHQIARRDQPDEHAVLIHERQLLDLPLGHQPLRVLGRNRPPVDDEALDRRHPVRDAQPLLRDEPHVALGQQPLEPPRAIHHDQRPDPRAAHDRGRLLQRRRRLHVERIGDDAVLRPLDDADFANLRLDLAGSEAAVDDPDPALLGLHDRHRRARDRVHVGRDDGALQRDAARQPAREVDGRGIAAFEHAVLGREDEVVERAAACLVEHAAENAGINPRESRHTGNGIMQGRWNPRAAGRKAPSYVQEAGREAPTRRGVKPRPTRQFPMAISSRSVRQYHVPSTSAGEASVRALSWFTCSRLNSRPAFSTKVSPWSFVKNTLPSKTTGDAEKLSRAASPSRPCHSTSPDFESYAVAMLCMSFTM